MAISSTQIAQQMAAQNSMFSGQVAMSHQLSYQSMAALNPGMNVPPPASAFNYAQQGQQAFMGAANWAGNTAMPMVGAGLGIAGGLGMLGTVGRMFDPLGMALRGGAAGFGAMGGGMAGLGGAAMGAAAGFMPFYAAGMAGSAYTGAAFGGMQDQSRVNSMLGQNFNFSGGGGNFGRGFSQGQMGQIGGMMHQTARQDPFTSMGELTSLAGMGSQMGMFTAVRDVKEFTKKFREMLGTLKTVQDELGGSLQEALQFVHEAKNSGIFKAADRAKFSGLVRQTSDVSGLSQSNVMRMTNFGSQLSRSLGGTGAQGAVGATLALRQVGAAVQGGVLSEELLSEATGGLTGDDAVMGFAQSMMQRVGRETRRGFGRYSIYGLANEDASGIDSSKMARFLAGDMSMSEIGRSAHQTVARIGRPRAMRNEGLLRAAAIQQGGIAFQAGKVRALLGDRVMSQDDDVVQAVMQRKFRMNRGEATAMTSLIRNLPEISTRMAIDSEMSDENRALTDYRMENQSFESVKRRLGSAVQEGLGIADTREWGRRLFSTVGQAVEKFTDDLFGIARQEFSQTGRDRIRRVMMGHGTATDFAALAAADAKVGGSFSGAAQLTKGVLQGGEASGSILQAMGYDVSGMNGASGLQAFRGAIGSVNAAMEGNVTGASRAALEGMNANSSRTIGVLSQAATIDGVSAKMKFLSGQGMDPRAALAFASKRKMDFGQGGNLTDFLQAGNSATSSFFGGGMDILQKAFGLDYSGASGGAQQMEDLLDKDYRMRSGGARFRTSAWSGVEESDFEGAMANNPTLREAAKAFAASPDLGGINAMRVAAMSGGLSEGQRVGMLKYINRLSDKMEKGEDISDMAGAMGNAALTKVDIANQRAMEAAAAELRTDLGTMADSLEGTDAEVALRAAAGGDYSGIRGAQYAIAGMDTDARSSALSALGEGASATAMRQGAMSLARERRQLSGGGRRGQRGARDAMHAMLGGGVANSLEVSHRGRYIGGRRARYLLDAGLRGRMGKAGVAAISEYKSGLISDVGFTEEEADALIDKQKDWMLDGRIDDTEAIEMQKYRDTSGVGAKLKEYDKRARARQDPLSSERNQHLKMLVDSNRKSETYLQAMAESTEGSKKALNRILDAQVAGEKNYSGE